MTEANNECDYFYLNNVSIGMCPNSTIEFKDGGMFIDIKSLPIDLNKFQAQQKQNNKKHPCHEAIDDIKEIFDDRSTDNKVGIRSNTIRFPSNLPNGSYLCTNDHRAENIPFFWESGFAFGLKFEGSIEVQNGLFKLIGLLRHNYWDKDVGIKIALSKQFTPQTVSSKEYLFISIEEALRAGPEHVYKLRLKYDNEPLDPTTQDLSPFRILKTLTLDYQSTLPVVGLETLVQLESLVLLNIGEIPAQVFSLTQLLSLHINSSKLSELPKEVQQLTALQSLNMYSKKLRSLPDEITTLTRLHTLKLQCSLQTLPQTIGNMPSLDTLDIRHNAFTSLPQSLNKLKNIEIEHKAKRLYCNFDYPSRNPDAIDPTHYLSTYTPAFKARIEEKATQFGLSEYIPALLAEARNALAFYDLEETKDRLIGETRFHGMPDLPSDDVHPMTDGHYWTFLAQIDLASVAHLQSYLPRSGVLSFFCMDTRDGYDEEYPFHKKTLRVFLFDKTDLKSFSYPSDAKFIEEYQELTDLKHYTAKATIFISLPSLYCPDDQLSDVGKKLLEIKSLDLDYSYENLCTSILPEQLIMHIGTSELSKPMHTINEHIFRDLDTPETTISNHAGGWEDEWINLLCLHSISDFCFGDMGVLTFLLHKKDLAIAEFENVYATIED